jgi:predicted metal-binding protein
LPARRKMPTTAGPTARRVQCLSRCDRDAAATTKGMGAMTYEIGSCHVPMLSHPDCVLEVIGTAARSV